MLLLYAVGIAHLVVALGPVRPATQGLNPNDTSHVIKARPASGYLALDLDPTRETNDSLASFSGENLHIQCDGYSYGTGLNLSDCQEAIAFFPASFRQVQWAERHTGLPEQTFPLPYKAMSNFGSCYVQPVLVNGASSATASPDQVRYAAAAILNQCATSETVVGGNATNIGEKKTSSPES